MINTTNNTKRNAFVESVAQKVRARKIKIRENEKKARVLKTRLAEFNVSKVLKSDLVAFIEKNDLAKDLLHFIDKAENDETSTQNS